MLTTSSEKTAASGETVGLKVERAIGGCGLVAGKVSLLDLETADKQDLVLDAGVLKEIAQLKMMDVDASLDDLGIRVDMIDAACHDRKCERREGARDVGTQSVMMAMTQGERSLGREVDDVEQQLVLSKIGLSRAGQE